MQWYVAAMPNMTVSKQISAPAADVWSILANFGDVSWIPAASRVEVDGEGPGMRRLIYGSNETPAVETMVSIDPQHMRLAYTITNNPLPVRRFESVAEVSGAPTSDTCVITWTVDYDPVGDSETDADRAFQGIRLVYDMMAGWLGEAASGRR